MNLVVFVGLQASGKNTFYRSRFAATHAAAERHDRLVADRIACASSKSTAIER
jgi:predicted kinase